MYTGRDLGSPASSNGLSDSSDSGLFFKPPGKCENKT